MEHKLIQGGEQYLPFARSRIKALKATGLKYASQKFEIDGVSVKVRIAGEHEYIELEGDPVKILSGVIKTGEVIELPVPPGSPEGTLPKKTLRSYKPTQNAWDYPLKKDPAKPITSFNDERFLANAGTQYAGITPSMFSGLMAKVVAIVMGRGKPVIYDYRWSRCHGVFLAADGKPWLVEVSAAQGVMVMRLPMDKGSVKSKVDAVKQATLLFGGVPNGKSFPTGDKLVAAIADGKVIRLKTPVEMQSVFTKTTYSSSMGWSFSPTAGEAHNTCYHILDNKGYSSHYKLLISVTAATLELVSQTRLSRFGFWFTNDIGAQVDPINPVIDNTFESHDPLPREATIFVCYGEAGALDIVRAKWTADPPPPISHLDGSLLLTFDNLSSNYDYHQSGHLNNNGSIVSTRFPASAITGSRTLSYVKTGQIKWRSARGPRSVGRIYDLITYLSTSDTTVPGGRYFGGTIAGVRDGYTLQNELTGTGVISSTLFPMDYWSDFSPTVYVAPVHYRVYDPADSEKYAVVGDYAAESSSQVNGQRGLPPSDWPFAAGTYLVENAGYDPGYPDLEAAVVAAQGDGGGPLIGDDGDPSESYTPGTASLITVLPRQTITAAVSEAGTARWIAMFSPGSTGTPSFSVGRVSVWGVQHTVLTPFPSYSATTYNLSGPLLAGEPNQTGAQYNFVGYT